MNNTSLVITSIAAPNAALKAFAREAAQRNISFIVIGDTKSPDDFNLEGCRFYSIAEQEQLEFSLAKLLPKKHYARKNIGYLLCKKNDIILESDDDNFPREDFWSERKKEMVVESFDDKGWINAYRLFSSSNIWPRGFPIERLQDDQLMNGIDKKIISPIQQGLADENPDVDAIYRMTQKLPIDFDKREPIALGKNTWCPFNSQNTTWFNVAFPLLYLPSYCTFRMTDIWRSFIAQRIAWSCDWSILFHSSTVWQERNEHNLLADFKDEIPGYLNNAEICQKLQALDLKSGKMHLTENLFRCYQSMVEQNFIGKEELPLVEAWCKEF